MRNVDRTVKDLQAQIERREKSTHLITEDLNKSRDKIERLLQTIDELQASDSDAQLSAKRAERELREEREKNLRLEREVEGLRSANSIRSRGGTPGLYGDDYRSRRESSVPWSQNGDVKLEVPQRKSSLSKGFL